MNFSNSRKIYPDPDADGIDYEPSEWRMCQSPPHCICHIPTWSIFQIGLNTVDRKHCRRRLRESVADVKEFYARIIHVCDPQYRPDEETLVSLGRAAIAAYLIGIGAWKPVLLEIPDTPQQKRIKSSYPKPN